MADRRLTDAGRELFWPRILFTEDLAGPFKMSRATAAKMLREGRFGPVVRIGRRLAVMKDSLLCYLEEQEQVPPPSGELKALPRDDSDGGEVSRG